MPLKELGFRLLSTLYELIFKDKMGNEARAFVVSTSYVGIGTLFGALLTLAFSIIAARILGPSNYGVLGLVTDSGRYSSPPNGIACYSDDEIWFGGARSY